MSQLPSPTYAPPPFPSTKTLVFIREKECKNSVRYASGEGEVVDTIYLSRKAYPTMPKKITVVITPEF